MPDDFDKHKKLLDELGPEHTESIDLNGLFKTYLTTSGSFDIRSDIWLTTFGRLIQALPVPALLIDVCGLAAAANEAWSKISPDYHEMLGRSFSELFVDKAAGDKLESLIEGVFSTRKPASMEAVLKISGRKIWSRMTFRSVRIMKQRWLLCLLEDLTHEKREVLLSRKHQAELKDEITRRQSSELALRRKSTQLNRILESISDGFLALDDKLVVTYFNRSAEELLGRERGEVIGVPLLDSFPELRGSTFEKKFTQALSYKKSLSFETFLDAHPYENWYDVRVYPLENGISVYFHITTERKKSEQMLLRSERLKAVAELAGGVAHNFNNLLQIVIGGLQLALVDLERGNLFTVRNQLESVLDSSKFGSETVRRLQSFANIRAEGAGFRLRVFDLSELARQAIEMTKPWWKTGPEKKGISISVIANLTEGCTVRGNESEIFEVLVNLIKNAAEALPSGGEITLESSFDEDLVRLRVQDSGVGIGREHLSKVFDPFWTTKGFDGTGMGLAVSYAVINRHEGGISVESTLGKGSVFTVTLPRAEMAEENEGSPGEAFDKRLAILVIDDLESVLAVLKDTLVHCNQEVLAATSGIEGLEIFARQPVDLVICDLGMPMMNGWEVGKSVKAMCRERGIGKPPFILLTGWGGQTLEAEKMVESGVDAVLEKPVDVSRLIETIKAVFADYSPVDEPSK